MNFIEPDNWIFQEYSKVFRHFVPAIYAQERMLDEITDRAAWQRTCDDWALNHYKPTSVKRMLDYYHEQVQRQVKSQVGKYDETAPSSFVEEPPCEFCGKQWCLRTHREQLEAA